ncbi:MAG: hypothetical protein ACQEQR_06505 [Pseudomonadota bacterium]
MAYSSRFKQSIPLFLILPLLLSSQVNAAEYHLVENPANVDESGTVLKDSWVVDYKVDDFTETVEQATVLYIPEDYRTQKVFFMRCRDFFANFSVQYLDEEKFLKDNNGTLPNASPGYEKHGYIYDDKQKLTVKSDSDSVTFDISVGGQNKALSKLFKTDIKEQPGLLGMSFHTSFIYKEMPRFKSDTNSSETKAFFNLLKPALTGQSPLYFELESAKGHKHNFSLDVKRMNQFVPKQVMDYCFTGRTLR